MTSVKWTLKGAGAMVAACTVIGAAGIVAERQKEFFYESNAGYAHR